MDASPTDHGRLPLPLVVQFGFSGSRRLFDVPDPDGRIEQAVARQLQAVLARLPAELGLGPLHVPVGVSQLAVGADMRFAEALQALDWPQRIVLPQPRDAFLNARGTTQPDFSPAERERALALLASPHVIEETVASNAGDRTDRFDETNLEILEAADVLVCLVRDGATDSKAGGAGEMIRRGRVRGLPVVDGDEVRLVRRGELGAAFQPPSLAAVVPPDSLPAGARPLTRQDDGSLPALADYAKRLRESASSHAKRRRSSFEFAAGVILCTHLAATAVGAGSLKAAEPWLLSGLIVIELALLGFGLWTHIRLHREHATGQWALARLTAELAYSASAQADLPFTLASLPGALLPAVLRPVQRTMHVLHRYGLRRLQPDWQAARDRYLQERLLAGQHGERGKPPGWRPRGQVPYYDHERQRAARWLTWASRFFTVLSTLAIVAVAVKGLISGFGIGPASAAGILGIAAVWLPVGAVAALSLAAAFDWQGRASTFAEMHAELQRLAKQIEQASSAREFQRLVAQTEARLIGETLVWYTRRAYTQIA